MFSVKLKDIVSSTEFEYNGRKYKKGGMGWSALSATAAGKTVLGANSAHPIIVKCEPYLGGQFQPNIEIWIGIEELVNLK